MRWICLLPVLAACGDEPEDSAVSPCADEDRASTLALGDSFSGDEVSLVISAADPLPAYAGENLWTIDLSDGAGALEGCGLSAVIAMPDHGHGGPAPAFSELGAGSYEAAVEFTMGGYWELDVSVSCGDIEDVVPVAVCVES